MGKTKRRAKVKKEFLDLNISWYDLSYNSITIDYSKSGKDDKSQRENTYGKRMKPYSKRRGKFAVEPANKTGISVLGKLITKNANRSLKKIRQANS
jgi:hypothetical protein